MENKKQCFICGKNSVEWSGQYSCFDCDENGNDLIGVASVYSCMDCDATYEVQHSWEEDSEFKRLEEQED